MVGGALIQKRRSFEGGANSSIYGYNDVNVIHHKKWINIKERSFCRPIRTVLTVVRLEYIIAAQETAFGLSLLNLNSPSLFEQWCGFFYVPKNQISESAARPDLPFFVLMLLQRQHFLISYFNKDLACWSDRGSNERPPALGRSALSYLFRKFFSLGLSLSQIIGDHPLTKSLNALS